MQSKNYLNAKSVRHLRDKRDSYRDVVSGSDPIQMFYIGMQT